MLARSLRFLGWAAYAGLLLATFSAVGYFSFNFFVRSGVTTVPDLTGITVVEAEALLTDQGLRLRPEQGGARYDDTIPAGKILQQSPGAGNLVKRGSAVEAVVSLGPQVVEVPDLGGKSLQAAQVTLSAAGLTVGRAVGIFGDDALPGTVVDQKPPPGSRAGRAEPVDVYLCLESRLQTYLMPDLTYRDYDQVRRYFERRGFRLGSVKFEPYEGISPRVVLRQFPLPGHPLRRRDVISLVVASEGPVGT